MKKVFVYAMAGALLMSSCGSYTASGAYTGSMLGSILGSAIGGLNDGPRGSDWGSILGMAGGAVVGAAVGSAADRAQEERVQQKRAEVQDRIARKSGGNYGRYDNDNYGSYGSGNYGSYGNGAGYDSDYNYGQLNGSNGNAVEYDPSNSGDDRIEFKSGNGNNFNDASTGAVGSSFSSSTSNLDTSTGLVVSNVRILDDNRNQQLESNEVMRLVFEVRNFTNRPLRDVRPHVVEVTGAKNIFVSPDARVESLAPGKGIRYTAMVKAGKRVKNGEIVLRVQATQGNGQLQSNVEEISIPTVR